MEFEDFVTQLSELQRLHAEGSYEEAYRLVSQLVSLCPFSVHLLVKKAKLMQLLDREDELGSEISLEGAQEILEQATILDPSAIEPVVELGHLAYSVNNDPDGGLVHFEKARRLAEGLHHEALVGKIRCLLELDEEALARDELDSAEACFGRDLDLGDLRAQLDGGTSTP